MYDIYMIYNICIIYVLYIYTYIYIYIIYICIYNICCHRVKIITTNNNFGTSRLKT